MRRFSLILVILLCLLLCSCNTNHKQTYEELYDEYLDLEAKYDDLRREHENLEEIIWSLETPHATVWCYFEGEPDVTFEEASAAFSEIDTILHNYYYPSPSE